MHLPMRPILMPDLASALSADCAPGPGVLVLLPPVALNLMCTAVIPNSCSNTIFHFRKHERPDSCSGCRGHAESKMNGVSAVLLFLFKSGSCCYRLHSQGANLW